MKTLYTKVGLGVLAVLAMTMALSAQATAQEGLDEELDHYWSAERDLDILRERLYLREGRFSVGLFAGLFSSEPNFYYFPLGLRAGYNFSNELGVEVGGAFMDAGFLTHDTELTEFFRDVRRDAFNPAHDTQDRFLWRANAVALWSPLYGKLAILQRKLAHFDLNLAGGLGAVGVERPALNRKSASNHVTMEVVLGAGAHFYLTRSLVVRLDGRGYVYRGAELPHNEGSFFGQLKLPMEFLLGATYLF